MSTGYTVKSIMKQLTDEYGAVSHDMVVNYIQNEGEGKTYGEYITKLKIKGLGKRIHRDFVTIDNNDVKVLKEMDIYGLLGCIEAFGKAIDIDLKEDPKKVKEIKSDKNNETNKDSKNKDEEKKKESKQKEESLTKEELNEWNKKTHKKFKTEIMRLKGNMKRLGYKKKKQLTPYVKKFSETKLNKTGEELTSSKDILPKNIKDFNNFLEKVIERKEQK